MIFLSDISLPPPFWLGSINSPLINPRVWHSNSLKICSSMSSRNSLSVYIKLLNKSSMSYRPCNPCSLGCLKTPFMFEDAIPPQEALVLVDTLQKS
jgi:hypothetical protein